MSNTPFLLKGAGISRPGLQGMLLAVLLTFLTFQANAQISNADAQALLQRHNQDRAAAGKPALCLNQKLMTAAENHCQDMATHNFFDHIGSDGSDIGTRIARTGYSAGNWGENIAWGYPTVDDVMNGWELSQGHYQNIVNGAFKEVGFARCGADLWVTDFAAPASGQTNCTNGTATTATTTTTTPAATKSIPNQAVYDQCKTFTDGWHYNSTSNKYRIYWNNSCYQYDGNTGNMYILRKTTDKGYLFFLVQ